MEPDEALESLPSSEFSAPLKGAALIDALRKGGYVIYFRHAATDMTQVDTANPYSKNCATQRNLNVQGRAEALAIGRAFLALGIPVGEVWSSDYCRAHDTAMLAFGQAKVSAGLTGFPEDQREGRIAALSEMLSTRPPPGANTVLVSHGFNITHTAGITIAEGEAAIFAPTGEDGFSLVARVLPAHWVAYHQQLANLGLEQPPSDPGLSLPNLGILAPTDLTIVTNTVTGKKLLKFTSRIQNMGPGVIEIWGHSDPTSAKTIVVQHIRTVDGEVKKVVVGEFVYHPDHEHFHYGNFARYEVWSLGPEGAPETLLSANEKVSYCLRDDVQVEEFAGIDGRQKYISCNSQRQGITPGWVDVYKSHLVGQSVDLTEVPDGVYALVNIVDPDHQLWERDWQNNTSMILFQLEGNRVRIIEPVQTLCAGDDCPK